jgi:uncharacterized protein YjlB
MGRSSHQDARSLEALRFADDGAVPNNRLPLVLRRGAVTPGRDDPAAAFEQVFARNGWTGSWRDGIFPYHHYHSIAHEVLGIAAGRAVVRFGGEAGQDVAVAPGDVVVIPAGVGHKLQSSQGGLLVVGAYPGGSDYDLIRADPARIAEARLRTAKVPLPETDPVDGAEGPLVALWREAAAL